jgi:superfamily II DNA or RNA helicase
MSLSTVIPQKSQEDLPFWPHQIRLSDALDAAIWQSNDNRPLGVGPVACGKTGALIRVARKAIQRGAKLVIIVSRSGHIAGQSLEALRKFAPGLTGALFTGASKKIGDAQIIFATAQTLAKRLDVVRAADVVLIDECDQAYQRGETKQYATILAAAQRYAGVTGTPFALEKGRTVSIFGEGKAFDPPCAVVAKAELRDAGLFHFIEPAPVTPARLLKFDPKKIDAGGDFDTKVQAKSPVMLKTIAEDTKAAMAELEEQSATLAPQLLPKPPQFLFFGSTTEQCDKQRDACNAAGLNVESYHNDMPAAEQKRIVAAFRLGEIQGLCTVSKVNRGFDLPNIALVVIAFATASRSKFEQMTGRAQRVLEGKGAALCLDYGRHGERFGSANWDYQAALAFDHKERLRPAAALLTERIRSGNIDPKCYVGPGDFQDGVEKTYDVYEVRAAVNVKWDGSAPKSVRVVFNLGTRLALTFPGLNGFLKTFLHAYGVELPIDVERLESSLKIQAALGLGRRAALNPPRRMPDGLGELAELINAAALPDRVVMRRIYDTYRRQIAVVPVAFERDGKRFEFDRTAPLTDEEIVKMAEHRAAYGEEESGEAGVSEDAAAAAYLAALAKMN